jgi:hypothetical protein
MCEICAAKIDVQRTGLLLGNRPKANEKKKNTPPALHQTIIVEVYYQTMTSTGMKRGRVVTG